MHIAVFAGLIATGAGQSTRRTATAPPGWQTYHSTDYGFTIDYPGDMTFSEGPPVPDQQRSMIPICDDTTVACFVYDGHAFDKTIIQSLGVSVNVSRDATTEAACNDIDDKPVKTIAINGTRFHFAETGSAAAGSSEGGTVYRAFHRGVCFKITLGIAQTDVAPIQYEEYGIHAVDEDVLRAAQDEMNRMLQSFTFTRRVRNDRVFEHPAP